MSNLGVITLSRFNKKKFIDNTSFTEIKVEDNIGESIHIHIDNFRMNFTIKQFNELSEILNKSLLNIFEDHELIKKNMINMNFLPEISKHMGFYKYYKSEKIKISRLKVLNYINNNDFHIYKLKNSNYFKNNHSIEKINYFKNQYLKNKSITNLQIILFGNQNIIRDGQHRACAIYDIDPEQYVYVTRIMFEENYSKYKISNRSKKIFKIVKKIKNIYNKIKHKFIN